MFILFYFIVYFIYFIFLFFFQNKVVALLNFVGLWLIGQVLGVTLTFYVSTPLDPSLDPDRCLCMYVCMCYIVCVCVCERERE